MYKEHHNKVAASLASRGVNPHWPLLNASHLYGILIDLYYCTWILFHHYNSPFLFRMSFQ